MFIKLTFAFDNSHWGQLVLLSIVFFMRLGVELYRRVQRLGTAARDLKSRGISCLHLSVNMNMDTVPTVLDPEIALELILYVNQFLRPVSTEYAYASPCVDGGRWTVRLTVR